MTEAVAMRKMGPLAMVARLPSLIIALTQLSAPALAANVHRPLYVGSNVNLLKRAVSADPSCPESWLCEQQTCPGAVRCPSGTVCINFEGNLGCVPPSSSWCALNPTTYQGVGCWNGICCHGNCYASYAVCCDNPSVQCKQGTACNVCQPEEECVVGGLSSCRIPSTTTPPGSVTSSVIVTSTSTVSVPLVVTSSSAITSTITTTTSSSPASTTSSRPPSSSSSSSSSVPLPPVVAPTIVSSVDSFGSPACYVDSSANRVLVNGSRSDHSTSGMTVEKCVELADSWRYAGIEAGGDCFWGDFMMSSDSAALAECRASRCAGNPLEACGGTNRIIVYEDEDYIVPTRSELADMVEEYHRMLSEFDMLMAVYEDALKEYEAEGGTDLPEEGGLAKRAPPLLAARFALMALRTRWDLFKIRFARRVQRAHRYQRIPEFEPPGLTNMVDGVVSLFEKFASSAFRTIRQQLDVIASAHISIGVRTFLTITGFFLSCLGAIALLKLDIGHSVPQITVSPPPRLEDPDPVCKMETCGRGVCSVPPDLVRRELEKRLRSWVVPSDIVVSTSVDAVIKSPDFIQPDSDWWPAVKNLLWFYGSNHGLHSSTSAEAPSSAFVPWNLHPSGTLITGAGPVYGCTTVIVVNERGAFTAHFWESFFIEAAEKFEPNVLDFLIYGLPAENYPSLLDLSLPGGPFANLNTFTTFVGIMTPARINNPNLLRYPTEYSRLELLVGNILGINPSTITRHVYTHDPAIWVPNLVWNATIAGWVVESWDVDRIYRRVVGQWRGYAVVDRRATDGTLGLQPAFRVHFENKMVAFRYF